MEYNIKDNGNRPTIYSNNPLPIYKHIIETARNNDLGIIINEEMVLKYLIDKNYQVIVNMNPSFSPSNQYSEESEEENEDEEELVEEPEETEQQLTFPTKPPSREDLRNRYPKGFKLSKVKPFQKILTKKIQESNKIKLKKKIDKKNKMMIMKMLGPFILSSFPNGIKF